MKASNIISWSLVATLGMAAGKLYFMNKSAEQQIDKLKIETTKPPFVELGEFPQASVDPRHQGQVQVNKLPHPLNVGGSMPYQVWVDGKRLPLNSDSANRIVDALQLAKGKDFVQPEDTGELHSGAGWMRPFPPFEIQ